MSSRSSHYHVLHILTLSSLLGSQIIMSPRSSHYQLLSFLSDSHIIMSSRSSRCHVFHMPTLFYLSVTHIIMSPRSSDYHVFQIPTLLCLSETFTMSSEFYSLSPFPLVDPYVFMSGCRSFQTHVIFLSLHNHATGCLKKRGISFAISISIKLNTNLLGIYLSRKMGSTALSGVQKHFCTISGSQGISKPIWGIKFQEFQIMNNLISLNMIST